MNSEVRIKFYRMALKYLDTLSYADRRNFATDCMYALMDNNPLPARPRNIRLSRTGTDNAEFRQEQVIKDRILKILISVHDQEKAT